MIKVRMGLRRQEWLNEVSTSYVGAIERADEFSTRIYGEATRRGLPGA